VTQIPALRTLHVDGESVVILDQTLLPHSVERRRLESLAQAAHAIRSMQVRGAPLIGATAAYGVALALRADASDARLATALDELAATRPTAVNLHWALGRMRARLAPLPPAQRAAAAWREAGAIAAEDAESNRRIGEHGLDLLRALPGAGQRPLRLMTHCNAGWLATVAHGTALAPIYAAHAAGLAVEVWVSETRPRNQGLLSAWELREAGIAHRLIADNAAGHLLACGAVDAVIVGADRIAANGDTANKIGTYLKALAAREATIPFWVAAPLSTVDWSCADGAGIPIEERAGDEVLRLHGTDEGGRPALLRIADAATPVANPAFDVTPAALIAAILTERGAVRPDRLEGLRRAAAGDAREGL
jgi:methylthioribose-1-phosphate isomerase